MVQRIAAVRWFLRLCVKIIQMERRQSRVSGDKDNGYEHTQRLSDSVNERVL